MLADKSERAERLRQAIANRGFKTLKAAADRHHFKESTLTSHANGTRSFDIETGYQYAKTFKVDPVWLLGLRGEESASALPSATDVAAMVDNAIDELPTGASIGVLRNVVASSLHAQLVQYQAAGGSLSSEEQVSALDKGAQSPSPTRPTDRAG